MPPTSTSVTILSVVDSRDLQPHLAVVDQHARRPTDRLEQFGMRQLDPVASPGARVVDRGRTCRRVSSTAEPPLNWPTRSLGPCRSNMIVVGRPNSFSSSRIALDQLRLLLLVAVAHVDPESVRAGHHQLADHLAGRSTPGRASPGSSPCASGARSIRSPVLPASCGARP